MTLHCNIVKTKKSNKFYEYGYTTIMRYIKLRFGCVQWEVGIKVKSGLKEI